MQPGNEAFSQKVRPFQHVDEPHDRPVIARQEELGPVQIGIARRRNRLGKRIARFSGLDEREDEADERPRRRQTRETVRSPENYDAGMPAFAAAAGGSLCVRRLRLPKDFSSVVTAFRDPNSQVRLVICTQTPEELEEYLVVPITIPPLASRPDEIDQIITEYAEDAIRELGALRTGFLPADRDWVRMHSASSLPDIEKATLRLVAIRASRNLSTAAARLGMAPVSLSRWIGRRKLPMHVEP
jgi:hypothetical protein